MESWRIAKFKPLPGDVSQNTSKQRSKHVHMTNLEAFSDSRSESTQFRVRKPDICSNGRVHSTFKCHVLETLCMQQLPTDTLPQNLRMTLLRTVQKCATHDGLKPRNTNTGRKTFNKKASTADRAPSAPGPSTCDPLHASRLLNSPYRSFMELKKAIRI